MWDREAGPGPRYKKYIFVYKSAGTEDKHNILQINDTRDQLFLVKHMMLHMRPVFERCHGEKWTGAKIGPVS